MTHDDLFKKMEVWADLAEAAESDAQRAEFRNNFYGLMITIGVLADDDNGRDSMVTFLKWFRELAYRDSGAPVEMQRLLADRLQSVVEFVETTDRKQDRSHPIAKLLWLSGGNSSAKKSMKIALDIYKLKQGLGNKRGSLTAAVDKYLDLNHLDDDNPPDAGTLMNIYRKYQPSIDIMTRHMSWDSIIAAVTDDYPLYIKSTVPPK